MARYDDKELRTSSYRGQEAYDRMLAECSISSLRFLSDKYDKQLDEFKERNNLNDSENWREYKDLQQRKKMIDEELTTRLMNESATITTPKTHFDSTTGLIYDEYTGDIIGSADIDEDEEVLYVRDFDGEVTNEYGPGTEDRKERYKRWDYWNP